MPGSPEGAGAGAGVAGVSARPGTTRLSDCLYLLPTLTAQGKVFEGGDEMQPFVSHMTSAVSSYGQPPPTVTSGIQNKCLCSLETMLSLQSSNQEAEELYL